MPSTAANPLSLIPPNAFDSHMHIIEPDVYPLAETRVYTPPPAPLSRARDVLLPQLCIVQPSIYGLDNACTLAALKEMGKERAVAVVVVDPDTVTKEQMDEWDAAGVRGVRINLVTGVSELKGEDVKRRVMRHADLIRPWGWVLQLYAPMSTIDILDEIIPSLGVPIVYDHFAFPASPTSPAFSSPGFDAILRRLLDPASQFFIKISAPYRIDAPLTELRATFKLYHRAAPERLVFASDWPHTLNDGYDTKGWEETVARWCLEIGGEEAVVKLFRSNAETLWRGREKSFGNTAHSHDV